MVFRFPPNSISDEYSFNPNGSTIAAIITNYVFVMLQANNCVRRLIIDFSKAFDSIDHLKLIEKLKSVNIADNMIQLVISFLTDRSQSVQMNESGHLHE